MTHLSRRQFAKLGIAASLAPLAAPAVTGLARPQVVVIGGGAGGATLARAVNLEGIAAVTLIEPQTVVTTCFLSNLYLGGLRSLASLSHDYDALAREGVRVVPDWAAAIDPARRVVLLPRGDHVAYDRLVVAPGIDVKWNSVPGYSAAAAEHAPHAWQAGTPTRLLSQRLDAVADGGLIVIIAPPNPYRCPAAPYERASMFAHALTRRNRRHRKRCKIVVLDPKERFAKQALFVEGWERHYPGMIEWQPPSVHGGIFHVDATRGEVTTGLATYKASLVNAIPAQMAGRIARDAGLADDSGFCPIEAASMRSAHDRNIFVLGDAARAGYMPKTAVSAASQARVAAAQIRADLTESEAAPAHYAMTCWSAIAPDDAVKVVGGYAAEGGRISQIELTFSQTCEAPALRAQTYRDSLAWYDHMVSEMFGI